MQKDSKLFDDVAKVTSSTLGIFSDMKREAEAVMMDKIERLMTRMQLVGREEFDLVKQMVEQARLKQEEISEKLAKLEKLLESKESR